MTRPAPQDHQRKPITESKPVNMPIITDHGVQMSCSCGGWSTYHERTKVRGDRAQRHLDKVHGGRGIWR